VRQRGRHPAGERLVARVGLERVEPHEVDATCGTTEPSRARAGRGSPRSQPSESTATIAPRPTRRPCSRLSSASASPIRVPPDQVARRRGRAGQRGLGVAAAKLAGDARQLRAEREGLHAAARDDRGVHVVQEHPRVGRHRARDVDDQDERALALAGRVPAAVHRLAAVAQRGAHGAAVVGAPAGPAARAQAAAAARRPAAREADEQPPGGGTLGVGHLGEVALAQQLDLAPGRRARDGRARRALVAGAGDAGRAGRPSVPPGRAAGRARVRARPATPPTRPRRRRRPRGARTAPRAGRGAPGRGRRRRRRRARDGGDQQLVEAPHARRARAAARRTRSGRAARAMARRRRGRAPPPRIGVLTGQPPLCRHRSGHAPGEHPSARTRSRSSRTLSATPSVASRSSVSRASSARAQAIVSPTPAACRARRRAAARRRAHALGHRLGHAGQPRADDLGLALGGRVIDPVVEAAALERVMQLARAVRRQHDERAAPRDDRAELGGSTPRSRRGTRAGRPRRRRRRGRPRR